MTTTFEIPVQGKAYYAKKPSLASKVSAIEALLGKKVEACSAPEKSLIATHYPYSALIVATKTAFNNHYPLILSPDAVWLTLTQGVARHINANAEELRKQFVSHEGKEKITVLCPGFIKGSPNNLWDGTLGTFSEKIKAYIGEANHKMFVAKFTTTGPVEQAASEVVLMDAVQQYFSYECMTLCGIPQVTLLGEVADWQEIYDRAQSFKELGLEWWLPKLNSVLSHFINSAKGSPDIRWWKDFFNEHSGSGGTSFNGNLFHLFPYTVNKDYRSKQLTMVKNRMITKDNSCLRDSDMPSSLSSVPFIWNYLGEEYPYHFVAGLVGVEMDSETNALTPVCGWAVSPD